MSDNDALLIEYQIAHSEVDRLNKQLWVTAQIIVPFSLTTFGLLAVNTSHSLQNILTIIVAGIISVLVLYGWFLMSKRWLGYQSIAQYRLIEIEKKLNLWCTRYEIQGNYTREDLSFYYSEDELNEISNNFNKIPKNFFPKGIKTLLILKRFLILMIIAWFFLIMNEIIIVSLEKRKENTIIEIKK